MRELPSVHALLERLSPAAQRFPNALKVREIRKIILAARERTLEGTIASAAEAAILRWAEPSLVGVINATGVVLHTNLGRAPLGDAQVIGGYSNLEYDLVSGKRGKRDSHLSELLNQLLGVPGIAVNNGAAALYLVLHELAEGGEVIVSRGELIEIGDGFRIPNIMRRSGAILREVGTTNKTRIADYREAITDRTRLILRVHPSNFHMTGFVGRPSREELVALSRETGIPVHEDLGSGCIVDLAPFGIREPTVQESLRAGVNLVSFSGDKLLGGPQAGLIAGDEALLGRVRRNPMFRALRIDKIITQILERTLRALLLEEWDSIPTLRMLRLSADEIRVRAEAMAAQIPWATVRPGESVTGGGATPDQTLPTYLIALDEKLEPALRKGKPPVIARIAEGRLLIDLRTVSPAEEEVLTTILHHVT